MDTIDISVADMLFGLLLLIVPFAILCIYKTGIIKSALISTSRMIVQLLLVGVYLKYIFDYNNAWLNILWIFVMVITASITGMRNSGLNVKKNLVGISIAYLIPLILVSSYMLYVVLRIEPWYDARYLISIYGILLGNIMSSNVIAVHSFESQMERDETFLYYLLLNGANGHEATLPFIAEALRKAFKPSLAKMAVMGIVAMPGMMIGQILGGNSTLISVKYQILIMIVIFTSSMLGVLLSLIYLSYKFIKNLK